MKLVKAERTDAIRIMEIINEAKAFLRSQGVNQWQTGYPAMADIQQGFIRRHRYVLKDQGRIAGYAGIDAAARLPMTRFRVTGSMTSLILSSIGWLSTAPSAARAFPQEMFKACENLARREGIQNIRVDTDEDNKIMRTSSKRWGSSIREQFGLIIAQRLPSKRFSDHLEEAFHPSFPLYPI